MNYVLKYESRCERKIRGEVSITCTPGKYRAQITLGARCGFFCCPLFRGEGSLGTSRSRQGEKEFEARSLPLPDGGRVKYVLDCGNRALVNLVDVSDFFFFCFGAGEREEAFEEVAGGPWGLVLIKDRGRGKGFRGGGTGGGRAPG